MKFTFQEAGYLEYGLYGLVIEFINFIFMDTLDFCQQLGDDTQFVGSGTFPLSPRIRVEELCTIYLYVVKPGKPVPFLRRRYCHEVETMGHDGVARYSGAP